MTAWWRGNRWFLVALVVIVPVAFAVAFLPRFVPYLDNLPKPDDVPRGETVSYAGAEFTLVGLDVFDGEEVDLPPGADLVVATVAVEVVEPAETYCDVSLVSDEGGVARSWDPGYTTGDFEVLDRFEQVCDLTVPGSYDLQQTFLVPHGEVSAPALQITSWDDLPRVLRLR